MSSGEDAFLKDLQGECLNDPESHFRTMREEVARFQENPAAGVRAIAKIAQTMKGHLESVGFAPCASLFAEFDTHLGAIASAFEALGGAHEPGDVPVLEFFVSDVIQNLEGYFEVLKTDLTDSEARAEERRPAVRILSSWRPQAAAPAPVATPEAGPVAAAPAAAGPTDAQLAQPSISTESAKADPSVRAAVESIAMAEDSHVSAGGRPFLICRSSLAKSKKRPEFRTFAIPIQQVLEVIDHQAVNPLPYPRAGIAGILNFRGDPLPILVCADRGEDALSEVSDHDYIVIARIGDKTFGFQMEQVLSVTVLDPKEFQSPDQLVASGDKGTWVTHLVKTESDVMLVMDLNKALAA